MTERVSKDDPASSVYKFFCSIEAFLSFRDVCLDDVVLFTDAEILACSLCSVDEVEVVCGVLIMQADESNFNGCSFLFFAFFLLFSASTSSKSCHDDHSHNQK